jgi:hypothetical protein
MPAAPGASTEQQVAATWAASNPLLVRVGLLLLLPMLSLLALLVLVLRAE